MTTHQIKCVIIDDEEMAAKVIVSHLEHIPDFRIEAIFHSAVEAFLKFQSMEVDVLFLDIQMPKVTGLEMIKMMDKKPLIVLTTAHREYALEGFELEVVDYLMKPIGLHRFLKTIHRLKKLLHSNDSHCISGEIKLEEISFPKKPKSDHIFIKSNRTFYKIAFDDILHIEAIKNHVKVVTNTISLISLISLTEFQKQLPGQFLRTHRSFIINTRHVFKFDNYVVHNQAGEIPIGRTYKDLVLICLKNLA